MHTQESVINLLTSTSNRNTNKQTSGAINKNETTDEEDDESGKRERKCVTRASPSNTTAAFFFFSRENVLGSGARFNEE